MRRTIWHWDLAAGVASGALLFVLWLTTSEWEGGLKYFTADAVLSLAIASAAWLGGRWASDRIANEGYGELVRIVDPQEYSFGLPYVVVACVGLASAAWAVIGAIVVNGIEGDVTRAALHSIALALFVWALAGLLDLILLSWRHQRRIAELRSMAEEVRAAEAQRNPKKPNGARQ